MRALTGPSLSLIFKGIWVDKEQIAHPVAYYFEVQMTWSSYLYQGAIKWNRVCQLGPFLMV